MQFDEYKASLGATKLWNSGLSTSVSLNLGQRGFIGDFPLLAKPRQDVFAGLTMTIHHNDFTYFGFTPNLSCSYLKNVSNVALFDYSVSQCGVRISREF
ncbi:MAG TPA: DUF560 domain-containing protein [Armatimonadetes bacterium]|nr:DUF560 domain-containing protein [Armatimonadota bacterium]